MANVGTATSGKTLIAAGQGVSPTFASIGTNSGLTAHGVLLAQGNSAFTALSPSSTSGIPVVSQGASSDPAFGTAVVAGGGTGVTSFGTNYSVLCSGTSSTGPIQALSSTGSSGQVLTSNGGGSLPSFQTIVTSTTWTDKSSSFSAVAANGYFITNTATATLPAGNQGDTIEFCCTASTICTIQAPASVFIRVGQNISLAAHTIFSTNVGDSVRLVYNSASLTWIATSIVGAWNQS